MNYLARKLKLFDQQIHCVITMTGRLDAGRLARAIRLTLDAEPVLGCRFVEHPRRPYWERRGDLDRLPLCSLAEPSDLESELWRFMAAPADPCVDPQVQVRIFRSQTDTLCIKLDHLAVDGVGTGQYISLLAATYRELAADPGYRPQPNLSGSRGQGQILKRCGPLAVLKALRHWSFPELTWHFPSNGTDLSGRAYALRRLRPERTRAITSYSRQHQVTVNDVLLAAFYRALFEVLDPPAGVPLSISVPINLRRYLPPDQPVPICNLSGAVFPALAREPGTTFDQTVARVHAAMELIKSDYPGLAGVVMYEVGFKLGLAWMERLLRRALGHGAAAVGLTNLGVIDKLPMDFGDVEVADIFAVNSVVSPGFGLGVSTYHDVMTFMIPFCDTATDRRLIEQILDTFVRELPQETKVERRRTKAAPRSSFVFPPSSIMGVVQ